MDKRFRMGLMLAEAMVVTGYMPRPTLRFEEGNWIKHAPLFDPDDVHQVLTIFVRESDGAINTVFHEDEACRPSEEGCFTVEWPRSATAKMAAIAKIRARLESLQA